ncbi:metallophosphoesterase [Aurantimonas coralicida]|uniref:Putative phosphoesterase n=1 Tax=Aurantimonas coralicida TaxID=182270 RepID=A0A0P0YZW8_9HYPH|nr:metallophosphoesterase [Aurantimonas coralicida]BAT27151.1 putative phosphoesterase [Aurantimonas coralicida]
MDNPRLLILSDLHQNDGGRPFDPATEISTPFDIAIVAGDCAGRLTSSVAWLGERFAGVPTIYVPGNHDWYRDGSAFGFTIEDELAAGRDLAARLGITLLSDEVATIGGLTILGATLWTDLHSRLHASRRHAFAEANRWMNDYQFIHRASSTRRSRRITPDDTLAWHRRTRRFLADAFADGVDPRRTIVVTHHAPSPRSLALPGDRLNHCYASDLEPKIRGWRPAAWIHGHIHTVRDYALGDTRIVANPQVRAGEASGFDPNQIIEV